MEVLVKNVYKRSKEFYKNIYAYYMFKRPIMIVLDCIALFYLAAYLVVQKYSMAWFTLVVPMIQIIAYLKYVRAGQKRDQELSGGEGVMVEMLAYDSHIEGKSSTGNYVKIEYSNIKKIKKLNGYIYLITKGKLVGAFKDDGYEMGDSFALLRLLNSKGIKV